MALRLLPVLLLLAAAPLHAAATPQPAPPAAPQAAPASPAASVPLEAALDNLKAFQHAEVVLYCRSGRRSALAEARLREHGFTGLVQLEGSWLAWEAAQLPVEVTRSEKPE